MSRTTRETGHVQGLEPGRVQQLLTVAVEQVGRDAEAEDRDPRAAPMTRARVREVLREEGDVDDDVAKGLEEALFRDAESAIIKTEHGQYLLDVPAALDFIRHREWRLATGRLDLAAAVALVGALDHAEHEGGFYLPTTLQALRMRTRAALDGLTLTEVY